MDHRQEGYQPRSRTIQRHLLDNRFRNWRRDLHRLWLSGHEDRNLCKRPNRSRSPQGSCSGLHDRSAQVPRSLKTCQHFACTLIRDVVLALIRHRCVIGLSRVVGAAFRSGAVMGFLLAGNGLLLLFLTIYLLKAVSHTCRLSLAAGSWCTWFAACRLGVDIWQSPSAWPVVRLAAVSLSSPAL